MNDIAIKLTLYYLLCQILIQKRGVTLDPILIVEGLNKLSKTIPID